jgi:leucyl-tRNA synthetase
MSEASHPDETPHRYTARLANEIEPRWQERWAREGTFRQPNPGEPGFDPSRPKRYVLDMFPYPSGAGLHVGHPEGYTATDIFGRYWRMKGCNVLHPMGWDAFGLPAEQYAVQTGVHPSITTRKAIENFRRQLSRFGFAYDWSREFGTIDPEYYRWTQWIWLQAYHAWFDPDLGKARPIAELAERVAAKDAEIPVEGGTRKWSRCSELERKRWLDGQRLVYLGEQTVNWCPKLGTVLANEEVIDGRSERGGHPVLRLPLRQWMFRITAYADRLIEDLKLVDWPASTRAMQEEWIGRSEGAEIRFAEVSEGMAGDGLTVFTTRPDTLFGATYMVVAPEHPLVERLLANPERPTDAAALRAYVDFARNRSDVDRQADAKTKTGVFTGTYARNPATGEAIPVWTADYVLMGYGTGAIMAVPAHDQRDFEFAMLFGLPIRPVVEVPGEPWTGERATAGEGTALRSANAEVSLDGLPTAEAKRRMVEWLASRGFGRRTVNYRLHDWLFSRQRYWGEPFPVVFDRDGNHWPVADRNLPVTLPELADFAPIESDVPVPPLGKVKTWVETTAGEAGVSAALLPPATPVRRETNTMPNWAGSCWYYLRFCDPRNGEAFIGPDAERYWLGDAGVDLYIGGAEHATLHLLYARFWHKMLFDLGFVSSPEPFKKLFHQGLILSHAYQRDDGTLAAADAVETRPDGTFVETATGKPVTQVVAKMSKALKNVVNPDEIIVEYGADTFRLYEMYMGPLEAAKPWNTRDIVGPFRFLQRLWRLAIDERSGAILLAANADLAIEKQLHRTIHKVGEAVERLSFNTAIAALIELVNAATRPTAMTDPTQGGLARDQLARLLKVLSPFAPHVAEELWHRLGNATALSHEAWPSYDPALLVDDEIEIPVQVAGKLKARITVPAKADAAEIERRAVADPAVAAALAGKPVKKAIVVPGRMVNLVI